VPGPRRSVVDWLFRDRRTGRIVVGQLPNLPLLVWIVASALVWFADPGGRWRTVLRATGTIALVVWAADEIARGVNPWRRLLGAGVLAVVIGRWSFG
jgi:hypothetical protein